MKWTLVWTRPALKDMKKLEPVLARRLREAMIELAETGHGDVVKLKAMRPPECAPKLSELRSSALGRPMRSRSITSAGYASDSSPRQRSGPAVGWSAP